MLTPEAIVIKRSIVVADGEANKLERFPSMLFKLERSLIVASKVMRNLFAIITNDEALS